MKFCSQCGEVVTLGLPENDNRQRFICTACETIHYQNPNIVAGVIPVMENKQGENSILMCKRAIEPRYGFWTLPAGFMENGESVEQAALRESMEEANLSVEKPELYMVMSLPHINQVYMMFKGQIVSENFSAGAETLETRLFEEHEIPWEEIAFPVIRKTLQCYFHDCKNDVFPVRNMTYQIHRS